MSIISKLEFDAAIGDRGCTIMHPWSPHCIPSALMMFKSTVIGFNKWFLGLMFVDVLLKWNRLNKEEVKFIIQSYFRTGAMCVLMSTTFITGCCILRKISPFSYYTVGIVPSFLGGLSIFCESKQRVDLILYTWIHILIETVFKHLHYRNIFKLNAVNGTVLFMIANGLVMYEIRKQRLRGVKPIFYWFFSPPPVRDQFNNNNFECESVKPWSGFPCPHEGSCLEEIRKSTLKFLGFGYAFGLFREAAPNIRNIWKKPQLMLKYLFDKRTVSFGAFVGLYVALYKISSCYLCQSRQTDSDSFGLPCGSIAGLAFWLQPKPVILAAILANLIFMYGKKSAFARSKLPMAQLSYAVINAILFHNYAFFNELSPSSFTTTLNVATNNRSHETYKEVVNLVRNLRARPLTH